MQTRSLGEKFFTQLGKIKVSKWPFFMVYRPRSFAIKGSHTRQVMRLVKPGDILVRSFNGYVNNYLIPGTFHHVGFYLSDVTENHLKQLGGVENPTQFKTGRQMVIHAIGEKIYLEDLIDFCRCDGLAIMRFPSKLKSLRKREIPAILQEYFADPTGAAVNAAEEIEEEAEEEKPKKTKKKSKEPAAPEPVKLDATTKALVENENKIAQHIAQGKMIEFEKIFKLLYRIALRKLSTDDGYDFGMESCYATRSTEFVYFITKSIGWNYGIDPEFHRVFFKQRSVITPDTFIDADLEEVWKSDI